MNGYNFSPMNNYNPLNMFPHNGFTGNNEMLDYWLYMQMMQNNMFINNGLNLLTQAATHANNYNINNQQSINNYNSAFPKNNLLNYFIQNNYNFLSVHGDRNDVTTQPKELPLNDSKKENVVKAISVSKTAGKPIKPAISYLKKKKKIHRQEDCESKSSKCSSRTLEKNSTTSTMTVVEKKKNMRNIFKYEEKTMLLGTKEEYEKFFKCDMINNPNQFSEVEKDLIEMINNPRRKKKKIVNVEININDYFKLSDDKIKELNQEVKAYVPFYQDDLEKMKTDKYHHFMMSNFPEIYTINNFFLYVKKNNERKKELNEKHLTAVFSNEIQEKAPSGVKSVWKANEIVNKSVEEYLFEVEKHWSNDEYKFSQEAALEFLKSNDFRVEDCLNIIKMKGESFKEILKRKCISIVKSEN